MFKKLLLIGLFLCGLMAQAQKSKAEEKVLAEAWLLYNSEKASWHGTDLFFERFPQKEGRIGGYFSYSEEKVHKCVFFDNDENPNVLATIAFDDNFIPEAASVDTISRKLTILEKDLFIIRQKAFEEIKTDTLFKFYKNTNPNLIPLITGKEKKVYILTGPTVNGVVVFGNDYLLEFDKKNNLSSKKALHKNIIPIEYNEETEGATTIHNHQESTGDLITATDVCTLMLYGTYTNWKSHIVMSKNNVCIWDCSTSQLVVLTRDAWQKMYGDNRTKN